MEEEKNRDNFIKSLRKLVERYKQKGVKIKSVEVEWGEEEGVS